MPVSEKNTLFSVIADLKAIQGKFAPGTRQYRTRIEAVARFLENNPDAWTELCLLIVEEDEVGIFAKWILIEALEMQSDSIRSHEILLSWLEDPSFPQELKLTATSVLSFAGEVPAETMTYLLKKSSRESDLRDVAMEALARCSRKSPRRAGEMIRFLSATLRSFLNKGDSNGAVGALYALGHTGATSETELVRYLTNHGCPKVRGAALVSLMRLDSKTSSAQVRHALRNDANPLVRIDALEALKLPLREGSESISDELLTDLLWTARNDLDVEVRMETLRFFHQSYNELPGQVRDAIGLLAEADSSGRIRGWAKWYLKYGFSS